jgi:hypothetical protein
LIPDLGVETDRNRLQVGNDRVTLGPTFSRIPPQGAFYSASTIVSRLSWGNYYQHLAHGYRLRTTINYLVVGKLRSGFSLVSQQDD